MTTATIATTPKTQLQPPFGPSKGSLCHPWITTTNLSKRFPIFETSGAALCGATGILKLMLGLNVCKVYWREHPVCIVLPTSTSCRSCKLFDIDEAALKIWDVGISTKTHLLITINWRWGYCNYYFSLVMQYRLPFDEEIALWKTTRHGSVLKCLLALLLHNSTPMAHMAPIYTSKLADLFVKIPKWDLILDAHCPTSVHAVDCLGRQDLQHCLMVALMQVRVGNSRPSLRKPRERSGLLRRIAITVAAACCPCRPVRSNDFFAESRRFQHVPHSVPQCPKAFRKACPTRMKNSPAEPFRGLSFAAFQLVIIAILLVDEEGLRCSSDVWSLEKDSKKLHKDHCRPADLAPCSIFVICYGY